MDRTEGQLLSDKALKIWEQMGSRVGKTEIDPTLASLLSRASAQDIKRGMVGRLDVGMMWLHGLLSILGIPGSSFPGIGSSSPCCPNWD